MIVLGTCGCQLGRSPNEDDDPDTDDLSVDCDFFESEIWPCVLRVSVCVSVSVCVCLSPLPLLTPPPQTRLPLLTPPPLTPRLTPPNYSLDLFPHNPPSPVIVVHLSPG